MKAITPEEMRNLDNWAISKVGIPRAVLMENAGRGVVEAIKDNLGLPRTICVLAGKGGNGGDGLVAARHLSNAGAVVSVFLVGKKEKLEGETKANLNIAEKAGLPVVELTSEDKLKEVREALLKAEVVVDALLGTGFEGEVGGLLAKVIDLVNETKRSIMDRTPYKIVSVDVPSGLDALSGRVGKHTMAADITVTFAYPKIGLLSSEALDYVGKLVIADIGIPKVNPIIPPPAKLEEEKPKKIKKIEGVEVTGADYVAAHLPRRKVGAHKGECGRVLVIAGSPGMTGAAVLSAKGALRIGAGLVLLGVPKSLSHTIDSMAPEVITLGLPETKDHTLNSTALDIILKYSANADVIALGPGLSQNSITQKLVRHIIKKNKNKPMLLDADGINAIAKDPSILKESKAPLIITPHPGEMSRLLKSTTDKIQADRIGSAIKAAKDWKVIITLKGAYTVVTKEGEPVYINPTGNPGMASAGVGDVLTGVIAGLVAQGAEPFPAAIMGVFIHGAAGDVVASIKGQYGLIASDILEALPYVLEGIIHRRGASL